MTSPTAIAAYMAFFTIVGFGFLFANLVVGRFVRPKAPNVEKLEVYECGEPTIGSSFVQFDLRFYVVALLFIIFDVEIAFFFPWATVFGKATQLMDPHLATVQQAADSKTGVELTPAARGLFQELGVKHPTVPAAPASAKPSADAKAAEQLSPVEQGQQTIAAGASRLALLSIFDILAFFAVLMVGFAYVWKRGDLDWVRALSRERAAAVVRPSPPPSGQKPEPMVSV